MATGTEIVVSTPAHALASDVAAPEGAGRWPGVVVIHDVFGLTKDTRRQCDWLADAGYVAMAPDLYGWGGKIACIRATFRDLFARKGAAFDDIDAVRNALAARPDCTGKVGIIGFCMGGGFALMTAAGHGFAASSVNYGMVPQDVLSVLGGACPVIGSFGGRDRSLKGAAGRLEHALEVAGVAHDVSEYPDASHSFLNDHGGLLAKVTGLMGMGFHAPSAAAARLRILGFFAEYLA